jgi:hypothetical protein
LNALISLRKQSSRKEPTWPWPGSGPIYINANSSFTQFWHGWGDNQAVSFSVVVSGGSAPGVLNPLGRVTFRADEVLRHVTGTIGRFHSHPEQGAVQPRHRAHFGAFSVDLRGDDDGTREDGGSA